MGNIVEYEGNLYIYVTGKSNEDMSSCSYDRTYSLFPYDPELPDDLVVDAKELKSVRVTGMKNPVQQRPDKIPYIQVGESDIKGVKKYYLERDYPKKKKEPTK